MPLLSRLRIRTRLTLFYMAVFSLIFGAVGVFLFVNLRSTLESNALEGLEVSYRGVYTHLVEGDPFQSTLVTSAVKGDRGRPEVIGQILDASGRVVESSGQAVVRSPVVGRQRLSAAVRLGHWHGVVHLSGRPDGDAVIVVPFHDGARKGSYLVLAQTLQRVTTAVFRLTFLFFVAAPVAVAIAGVGGWLVARAALRPVDDLTRRAAAIGGSGPHAPLPVPATDDEVARLATTLNGMLGRLDLALDAERRFTADASHELRTPLAVIEGELDVALRSSRTPAEAKEILASVRDETSSLARIVSNLLLLARTEATGHVTLQRHSTDLLELAMATAARFRSIAKDRGVALDVCGAPVLICVDPELMRQAIANLVDNALTHTGSGGSVTVNVGDGAEATVAVADTGEGIPAAQLPRIFERFYRVDGARDRQRGGSGLGLEITQRIVNAHGGTIVVDSEVGVGTNFVIRLPILRAA